MTVKAGRVLVHGNTLDPNNPAQIKSASIRSLGTGLTVEATGDDYSDVFGATNVNLGALTLGSKSSIVGENTGNMFVSALKGSILVAAESKITGANIGTLAVTGGAGKFFGGLRVRDGSVIEKTAGGDLTVTANEISFKDPGGSI